MKKKRVVGTNEVVELRWTVQGSRLKGVLLNGGRERMAGTGAYTLVMIRGKVPGGAGRCTGEVGKHGPRPTPGRFGFEAGPPALPPGRCVAVPAAARRAWPRAGATGSGGRGRRAGRLDRRARSGCPPSSGMGGWVRQAVARPV